MEYNDLEKLWLQYDNKLNRLEELNKKIIFETLSKKPQKKISWLQFRNYLWIVMGPLILIVALHPQFKPDSLHDAKFVTGTVFLLFVVAYSTWFFISLINKLKKIDLTNNTVIESAKRINDYKQIVVSRFKATFITMPVTWIGVLLIGWNGLTFDKNLYLLIIGTFLFAFLWGKKQLQEFKRKMDKLGQDIDELKMYKE